MQQTFSARHLQDGFLRQLAVYLDDLGFKYKVRDQSYIQKNEVGWNAIYVGFIPHPKVDVDLTGSMGVRLDAVETIANDLLETDPKYRSRTATIGVEFGNWAIGQQLRWTLQSDSDFEPVADGFLRQVKQVALPFFERFSDPGELLRTLSESKREATWISPIDLNRWILTAILCKLLGEENRLDAVIEQGLAQLDSRPDKMQASRFRKALPYIRALQVDPRVHAS